MNECIFHNTQEEEKEEEEEEEENKKKEEEEKKESTNKHSTQNTLATRWLSKLDPYQNAEMRFRNMVYKQMMS